MTYPHDIPPWHTLPWHIPMTGVAMTYTDFAFPLEMGVPTDMSWQCRMQNICHAVCHGNPCHGGGSWWYVMRICHAGFDMSWWYVMRCCVAMTYRICHGGPYVMACARHDIYGVLPWHMGCHGDMSWRIPSLLMHYWSSMIPPGETTKIVIISDVDTLK